MVEVLGVFGFLSWLFVTFCEWLSCLAFFPAVVLGCILIPVLAGRDYRQLARKWQLQGMFAHREPVPPERFYWGARANKLGWRASLLSAATILAWWNAATFPASLTVTPEAILGWLNAIAGILTSSRLVSLLILFFRASQWFDAMTPDVVGLFRRTMYRLSDNYEYLGQKKRDPEKEEVY